MAAIWMGITVFCLVLALAMAAVGRDRPEEAPESEEIWLDAEIVENVQVVDTIHLQEPVAHGGHPWADVRLLAAIMQQETRPGWPDWAVMCVGEVVLNRVASPLFPGTIREVLYQTGPIQYEPVWSPGWEELEPGEEYIELAVRLLDGERPLNDPEVVWQALFRQGTEVIVAYHDRVLNNTTYFCR